MIYAICVVHAVLFLGEQPESQRGGHGPQLAAPRLS